MNASTVIVASTNPVKLAAAEAGFRRMFPQQDFHFHGHSVPSGVSHQPMSSDETRRGAAQRAAAAALAFPQAAYTVGIEGGCEPEGDRLRVFAWVVAQHDGRTGQAMTGVFYLPQEVARLIHQGLELGAADDAVFGRSNSKQANGSIGLLTDDALTRADYYMPAVIMALIPFKKPQFTWG
jgi:inosine/xanthosine triphosphatase